MTEKFNTYNYEMGHSTFGGILYNSDFDTNHSGSRNMARRIAQDWMFDKHCASNEKIRNNRINWEKKNEG